MCEMERWFGASVFEIQWHLRLSEMERWCLCLSGMKLWLLYLCLSDLLLLLVEGWQNHSQSSVKPWWSLCHKMHDKNECVSFSWDLKNNSRISVKLRCSFLGWDVKKDSLVLSEVDKISGELWRCFLYWISYGVEKNMCVFSETDKNYSQIFI